MKCLSESNTPPKIEASTSSWTAVTTGTKWVHESSSK